MHNFIFLSCNEYQIYFADLSRNDERGTEDIVTAAAPFACQREGRLSDMHLKLTSLLKRHNIDNPSRQLNIVLFDDAVKHILRIARCLGMSRGSMVLMGTGGTGKRSLTRLASYCMGFRTIEVPMTNTYLMTDLLHDIRTIFTVCGVQDKGITFLVNDKLIHNKDFLEVIYSLLTTGEVPFLFTKEELLSLSLSFSTVILPTVVKRSADLGEENTDDNKVKQFMNRVRSNLHIIFCLSPLLHGLSDNVSRYPGRSCLSSFYCRMFLSMSLQLSGVGEVLRF